MHIQAPCQVRIAASTQRTHVGSASASSGKPAFAQCDSAGACPRSSACAAGHRQRDHPQALQSRWSSPDPNNPFDTGGPSSFPVSSHQGAMTPRSIYTTEDASHHRPQSASPLTPHTPWAAPQHDSWLKDGSQEAWSAPPRAHTPGLPLQDMPSLTLPSRIPYGPLGGSHQAPVGAAQASRSGRLPSRHQAQQEYESEEVSPRGLLQGELSALAVQRWLESQAQLQAQGQEDSGPPAPALSPTSQHWHGCTDISPRGKGGQRAAEEGPRKQAGQGHKSSFGGCAGPGAVQAGGAQAGRAVPDRGQLARQGSQQGGRAAQHAEEADTPKLFLGPEAVTPVFGQGRAGARRETTGELTSFRAWPPAWFDNYSVPWCATRPSLDPASGCWRCIWVSSQLASDA